MTPMVKVPPAAPEASPLALPAVSPLVLAPPASLPEVPALLLPPQATRARAMVSARSVARNFFITD